MIDFPLFIVGSYRAGTTLLRLVLSCHEDIYISDETGFIAEVGRRLNEFGDLSQPRHLKRLYKEIVRFLIKSQWKDIPSYDYVVRHIRAPSYPELIRVVCTYGSPKLSVLVWGDNTPRYVYEIAYLKQLFPNARFLVMVRDGRDVYASVKQTPFGKGLEPEAVALEWTHRLFHGLAAHRYLGPQDVMLLKYEKFVQAPVETLTEIIAWLGVHWPGADVFLRFYETADAQHMSLTMPHHANLVRPISPQGVGRFRRDLSKKEILCLEKLMAPGLLAFGYELVNPVRPNGGHLVHLRRLCWSRLAQKYGALTNSLKQIIQNFLQP